MYIKNDKPTTKQHTYAQVSYQWRDRHGRQTFRPVVRNLSLQQVETFLDDLRDIVDSSGGTLTTTAIVERVNGAVVFLERVVTI